MSALSSVLGNVDISQAYIGTLTVGTSNIDPGAVSDGQANSRPNITVGAGSETHDLDVTVTHGLGSPQVLVTAQTLFIDDVGGTPRGWTMSIWDVNSNQVLENIGGQGTMPINWMTNHRPPSNRPSTTYRLRLEGNSFIKFWSIKIHALALKR